MLNTMTPTIVFKGDNEFEAQMARDILTQAGVPVMHVPSLSTGVFGFRQTTRVAVPQSYVEQAVTTLSEAGFRAAPEEAPKGAGAFQTMFQDALPLRVRRLVLGVWILGALIILIIVFLARS